MRPVLAAPLPAVRRCSAAAVGLYQERCWWVGCQLGIEIQAILFPEEVFSRTGEAAGGSATENG